MSAREIRMRVARHYRGILERIDGSWDRGECTAAMSELERAWPQIHAQLCWLRGHATEDSEARGLAARYPVAARHVLRAYLPAQERREGLELQREVAAASGERGLEVAAHCELAVCAHELGQPERALEHARTAWAVGESLPDPRLRADVLWALGYSEHVNGQDHRAVESFSQSLALRRELLDASHPEVVEALNGVAWAWSDLDEHQKVIELLSPVAPLGDALPVVEHAKLAATYRLLGTAFGRSGDLARAEQCCARALELDRRILAPGHRDLAVDLNDLAIVRHARGDLRGAIDCMREALAIDEKNYGESHPAAGLRMSNLGVLWREVGEQQLSLVALRRCLEIFRATYGDRHPTIANALAHLGRCLLDLRDPDGAVAALTQSIEMRRELQGEEHPRLAGDREALAAAQAARDAAQEVAALP